MTETVVSFLTSKTLDVNLCWNRKEAFKSILHYLFFLLFLTLSDVIVEEEREVREIRRGNQIQSSSRILYRWDVRHV